MNISNLITLASNRLMALNVERATAVTLGNIGLLDRIDNEIAETQRTLDALQTLT